MKLNVSSTNNAIIAIESLRSDDLKTGNRLFEDIFVPIQNKNKIVTEYHSIKNKSDMFKLLYEIKDQAERGIKPILHFDFHGDSEKGLEINPSKEYFSWEELTECLRKINSLTKNNLGVVLSACDSLHAITSIDITKASPYWFLIGSEYKVTAGFIEEKFPLFYLELFENFDLMKSFQYIEDKFKLYHSEKMFLVVIAKYFKKGCSGKSGKSRKERLITEAMNNVPYIGDARKQYLKYFRTSAKDFVKPSEEVFERYANTFLLKNKQTNRYEFCFEDVISEVKN